MIRDIEIGDRVRIVRLSTPHRHPSGTKNLSVGDIVEVSGFYSDPISKERVLVYWRVDDLGCFTTIGRTGTDCTLLSYVELA